MARRKLSAWPLVEDLIVEGWQTPQTYSNHFSYVPEDSGIYAFIRIQGLRVDEPMEATVLYVGMSRCLAKRVAGHEILRKIREDLGDPYVQTWFRCYSVETIREAERKHIQRFRAPYNIVGRVRGEAWN